VRPGPKPYSSARNRRATEPMPRSGHHTSAIAPKAGPAEHLLRRLGPIVAALALAIQILMPCFAMAPMATASPAPGMEQIAMDADAMCSEMAAKGAKGQMPQGAHHLCPICWAMQQASHLVPPQFGLIATPTIVALEVNLLDPAVDFAPLSLPPIQPRGPPLV